MSLPRGTIARTYYRAAFQRFSEAELLLQNDRRTGAVYLAGYGVECMLKSLLLSSVPESQQEDVLDTFRGQQGHDFKLLLREFKSNSRASVPVEIEHALLRVNTWSTNLRYLPGNWKKALALEFFRDASRIIKWANERI